MKFSDMLSSTVCVSECQNVFCTVPCRVQLTIYQLYKHWLDHVGIIVTVGHLDVSWLKQPVDE